MLEHEKINGFEVCAIEMELAKTDMFEFLAKNYPKMIKV